LLIRAAKIDDAQALAQIRRQDGVRRYILAMTSEREEFVQDYLNSLGSEDIALAACEEGQAVGFAFAVKSKAPKLAHSAIVTVLVDSYKHNRGIGTRLINKLVEEADKKGIHRLQAYTMTDNAAVISIYKNTGFEQEALRKSAAVRDGELVDEILFARINSGGAKDEN
jgi:putative acetyltransferase